MLPPDLFSTQGFGGVPHSSLSRIASGVIACLPPSGSVLAEQIYCEPGPQWMGIPAC